MSQKNKNLWIALPRYVFRRYNILREVKRLKEIKTFIDIGCGAGDLAINLTKLGLIGKGFDFSEEAIENANFLKESNNLTNEIEFKVSKSDISELNSKADLITCMEVLEHIKDHEKAFRDLKNISNKYLMISVPAKRNLFTYIDTLAGYYRRYDRKDVIELFEKNNVEIVKIIAYGYPFTNLIRLFREYFSKKALNKPNQKNIEDRTKKSSVNIFKIGPLIPSLYSEKLLLPFIWISLLFNRTNLREGYLFLGKIKKEKIKNI